MSLQGHILKREGRVTGIGPLVNYRRAGARGNKCLKRKSNLGEKWKASLLFRQRPKLRASLSNSLGIIAIVNSEQYINICFIDSLGLSLYLTSKPNNSTMVRFIFLYIYLQFIRANKVRFASCG